MSSEREQQLEQALEQFLKPIKGIPFEVVVKSLCGYSVMPFDRNNAALIDKLVAAVHVAAKNVQAHPIVRPRPNEVGNDMEPFVIKALNLKGFRAAAPKTQSGMGKSTGYPDIRIETDNGTIYLEVKTYAAKNHTTTQRSFYLSPADDSKVIDDGHHLLVGFEMEQNGNSFKPVGFEIVDLYGLNCDMKAEFNSDNKRIYEPSRLLASKRL